ncbi:hypothetical protein [Rickettsia endosymbiont of Seladonia tumulorum]
MVFKFIIDIIYFIFIFSTEYFIDCIIMSSLAEINALAYQYYLSTQRD